MAILLKDMCMEVRQVGDVLRTYARYAKESSEDGSMRSSDSYEVTESLSASQKTALQEMFDSIKQEVKSSKNLE